jgi:hypothetical protein
LRDAPRDRRLTYADLWPEIRLLTVWTGGSCGIALESLKRTLPKGTWIMELGYLSSELRGTVTVDGKTGDGVPTLHHNFFEFIEPHRWEEGERNLLRLHELEPDRDYYVVVTTGSGLYRYFMNDIVRVTGRFENTATVRFLQKGRGVTSITGEKLYESQLLGAVKLVAGKAGVDTLFIMCLADERDSGYRLYLETEVPISEPDKVAEALDVALSAANMEYEAKLKSGRLKPIRVCPLQRDTGEAYKAWCVQQGQKESQFKTIALQYRSQFEFPIDEHVVNQGTTGDG